MPSFDPYFTWLKIPPGEQPPNHYRLLSTPRFESDPEVIESAVSKLVERLQSVSSGDQAEHAQRILNDVARARLVLTDPRRKSEYDKQLRKQMAAAFAKVTPVTESAAEEEPTRTKEEFSIDVGSSSGSMKTVTSESRSKKQDSESTGESKPPALRRRKTQNTTGLLIGYAAAAVAIAIGAIFFLSTQLGSSENTDGVNSDPPSKQIAKKTKTENDRPDVQTKKRKSKAKKNGGTANQNQRVNEKEVAVDEKNQTAANLNSANPDAANLNPVSANGSDELEETKTSKQATEKKKRKPNALKNGTIIIFDGPVSRVERSGSNKTWYVYVTDKQRGELLIWMKSEELQTHVSFARLEGLVGKTLKGDGVVKHASGRGKGINIKSPDELELPE